MKKFSFILMLPFLASCATRGASERQPNSVLPLLSGEAAQANDNRFLLKCTSDNTEVIRHLFKNSEIPEGAKDVSQVRLTFGQDLSEVVPFIEMRVDFLNSDNQSAAPPKNFKRIAYTESPETGRISISYSPSATFRNVGARAFNMLIDETNGKFSFLQQNASNAPNHSVDFDCDRSAAQTLLPKSVDLSTMNTDQKLNALRLLQRSLPTRRKYIEDENAPPPFATESLAKNIKMAIENLKYDEAQFRKLTPSVPKNATVAFVPPTARCSSVQWRSYGTILDLTGKAVAYTGDIECKESAVTSAWKDAKGNPQSEKYAVEYRHFYIVGQDVLAGPSTNIDFLPIDEE